MFVAKSRMRIGVGTRTDAGSVTLEAARAEQSLPASDPARRCITL
jgi:hypothetical protein